MFITKIMLYVFLCIQCTCPMKHLGFKIYIWPLNIITVGRNLIPLSQEAMPCTGVIWTSFHWNHPDIVRTPVISTSNHMCNPVEVPFHPDGISDSPFHSSVYTLLFTRSLSNPLVLYSVNDSSLVIYDQGFLPTQFLTPLSRIYSPTFSLVINSGSHLIIFIIL